MKTTLSLLLLLLMNTFVFGQIDKIKVAVLMAVNGDSYVKNKTGETKLEIPYFFQDKDVIEVRTGKVEILNSNGSELTLNKGDAYHIEIGKDAALLNVEEFYTNLSKEKYFTQSQSNSALTVRGQKTNIVLFPISSKLANKNQAFITCHLKTTEIVVIELEVLNMQNDEIVYSSKNITSTEIALNEMPLLPGQDYVWTLKADGKETDQIGLITYLDTEKQKALLQFNLKQKVDYLKAYQYYAEKELWFAAKRTIQMAAQAYPETDLFEYLLKMMLK
ncbi:MAG: DUF928 domain-containing protein [Salinivirgaceae bacterium]|nr:DUF928 domain-containing protein [Salinivirgaceae bacterium]